MELTKTKFKQTDVGLIPEDWVNKRLKEISLLITKGTTPHKFSSRGVKYVKIESLVGDSIDFNRCLFVEEKIHNGELKRSILVENDILFAIAGATIGKLTIVNAEIIPANTNQALAIIRLNKEQNVKYVFFVLRSYLMQKYILDNIAGGAQPNLNLEQIGNFHFALPHSVAEQKAIANALGDVDELIAKLEKLIEKKKVIKQGAMQALLTPPNKGGKRLEGFSGEWVEKRIHEIASTPVTDGPHETPRFIQVGVPFLSVNNIVNNRINWNELRFISKSDDLIYSKKCKPQKYDILLGKAASVGKVAIVESDIDFNIWSPLALIRCSTSYSARFIFYQLQTPYVLGQINVLTNSSSQGNIGMGDIEKIILHIPNLDEQKKISDILFDMDSSIEVFENKKMKMQNFKQGMMQELLTGRTRLV
jgi:type I restriction enzyme S subunit